MPSSRPERRHARGPRTVHVLSALLVRPYCAASASFRPLGGPASLWPNWRPYSKRGPALTASGRAGRLTTSCGVTTPATEAAAMPLPLTDREREIAILISQGLVQHRHRPSPHPVGTHHRRPHLPRLCAGGYSHPKRTRPAHNRIRACTWLLTTLTDRFDGGPTPPQNQQATLES